MITIGNEAHRAVIFQLVPRHPQALPGASLAAERAAKSGFVPGRRQRWCGAAAPSTAAAFHHVAHTGPRNRPKPPNWSTGRSGIKLQHQPSVP